MTLDDALRLAGQVLADYEDTGPGTVPGSEGAWAGRLAQPLPGRYKELRWRLLVSSPGSVS